MKQFLKKKWHRVPVALVSAILVLTLVAGGAFAAYNFLGFTTVITVDEPLKVEMRWYDYNTHVWTDWWVVDGEGDELDLFMSPAEVQTFGIRVYNISYGELEVATTFTGPVGHFDFVGFPNGIIPGSNGNNSLHEWAGVATITADGDTPPGNYSVAVTFTRE